MSRNVLSYVPKTTQSVVRHRLKSAWSLTDHEEALRALRNTAEYLEGISAAAANSLREGMEETLTLHELRVSPALRRTLSTTNPIESCFSRSRDLAGNVKRWRNEDMVQRWSGAILLEAEKKFRRIKGHRELPLLVATLREEEVDTVSSVA